MTIEEKLNLAINYIENVSNCPTFHQLYIFSTENLTFFETLNLKDKDILLTGSSADQILTSVLYDANKITHFDINPFVKEMLELKIAAIKELNQEEFLNFFYYYNDKNNYKTYLKIRNNLNFESLFFWDNLFTRFGDKNIKIKLFKLQDLENDIKKYKKIIPYLNNNNYEKLKNKLNEINIEVDFLNSDVLKIPLKLQKNYDVIYFSNIFSRIEMISIYGKKYIKTLYNFMTNILTHTNENGIILLDYFYGHNKEEFDLDCNKPWTYHVRFPIKHFKCEKNISYIEVDTNSDMKSATKDTILIYTKKKTN